MTIASEIERLQCAKADIKAAIEEKGVTVGSDLTLDDYANCITAIETGGGLKAFCYLLVGGGGGGGPFGGGGGGEVKCDLGLINCKSVNVVVGNGGAAGCYYHSTSGYDAHKAGCPGGNSYIGTFVARGGCGSPTTCNGANSGSGCAGGAGCNSYGTQYGGGGGGASGAGCPNTGSGGEGGAGLYGYGGGGGGSRMTSSAPSVDGGGCGGIGCYTCSFDLSCLNAKNCGGGGGSVAYRCQFGAGGCGRGGKGLAKICYPTDGSFGITCATGGTVTTSGGYNIHTFTSNGTFCIVC